MGGGASKVAFPNRVGLDHFLVDRQVGQGGFGKVNAVELVRTKEQFAMKTLEKKKIKQSKNISMINNERAILSRLDKNSKWVCGMHYAFQNQENCYLVLTLALGGDLRFHLNQTKDCRLKESRVKFYTLCLVMALKECHDAGIIHRDIKPDNVVIKANGYCVLTDFGISKVMDENGTCTGSSGTRVYMPPEALKKPHVQTKLADSYSLGVLVYELLEAKRSKNSKSLIQADKVSSSINVDGKADLVDYDNLEVSDDGKSFLRSILLKDSSARIGPEDMLKHAWFSDIDMKKFAAQELAAPWVPKPGEGYFEGDNKSDFSAAMGLGPPPKAQVTPKDFDHGEFNGYDWNLTIAAN